MKIRNSFIFIKLNILERFFSATFLTISRAFIHRRCDVRTCVHIVCVQLLLVATHTYITIKVLKHTKQIFSTIGQVQLFSLVADLPLGTGKFESVSTPSI